ncbi:hypothetical protein [Candidatus Magnetobacterium casense]|uniref:Uncharacterized protein n=1 Tax=Candidatus Magnetobacterium casense TaxID=1455061 RepID=A0ABS6S4H9_9BACT|nr:hypothetical protein [Candidatus Magnetobacterium casensis]MBV6343510.1 hypothetical protein [Candidatus Magnetobacterium casensis]
MVSIFRQVRRGLVLGKIYIGRALGWVGILNTSLLCYIAFKSYLTKHPVLIPLVVIGTIGGMVFLGWLDVRLGFYREEQRKQSEENPALRGFLK